HLVEPLADQARPDIAGAARRVGHDDLDGAGGKVLCAHETRGTRNAQHAQRQNCRSNKGSGHGLLPLRLAYTLAGKYLPSQSRITPHTRALSSPNRKWSTSLKRCSSAGWLACLNS